MPYNECKHGRAEYGSWVQVPSADYAAITQGADSEGELKDQHFARLVQVVGGISLSAGDISVSADNSVLEAILTSISGDTEQLVIDVASIETLISAQSTYLESISATNDIIAEANTEYSSIIRVSGTDPKYTWIMNAQPGSDEGDSVWRIKRVYESGENVDIQWPNGDSTFSYPSTAYLSLGYTY